MKWTSKIEEILRSKRKGGYVEKKIDEQEYHKSQVEPIPINFSLKALVVTDGHGCLEESDIPACYGIDVCFMLGDSSLRDIAIVKEKVVGVPIYGVLGNHDGFELYDRCGIENIHGKVVEVNGVRISGLQGSLRYKDTNFPFYTDEESVEIADRIEPADILISHDYPKHFHPDADWAHSGLQGITHYCEKHNVPINIHGHYHEEKQGILENGTRAIGCYKVQIVEIGVNGCVVRGN